MNPALLDTAARLDRLDPYAGFDVPPAEGPHWTLWEEVDGKLDEWMSLLTSVHGHRGAAGSLLGAALVRAVVQPTVAAMVLDDRCPDPDAGNVALRLDEVGELARAALLRPEVAVLATDPAAGQSHSFVVADGPAMVSWWARRTAATLEPLLAAVRARAPFGLPALWGNVADEVTSVALWVGQLAGRDPFELWTYAQELVEALAGHAPVRVTRPRPFPVAHPRGEQWFQVRGTCCLSYRSTQSEGPKQERYCSTCPLRDNDSRLRHLCDYLDGREDSNPDLPNLGSLT